MALRLCTGFEYGSTSGWATGTGGMKNIDLITGSPGLTTLTPRTGTYCLEITAAGAAERVSWNTNTIAGSQNRALAHFAIRFPTSLPAADVDLAALLPVAGAADESLLSFNNSDDTLRLRYGTGGTGSTGPVVVADTWYMIELYWTGNAATHTTDWWVDGTAQSQASKATAASNLSEFMLGSEAAATYTARYDDLLVWTDTAAITAPVGNHKVIRLSVDTGGTLTIGGGGGTGDFNTFAGATPTLTAWNATTARDAIDEVPVNAAGGTQDGFCLVTDVPTNTWYVEIPMASYTLAAGESIVGVRMLACGWQAAAVSATCGIRSWNGTTETVLLPTSTAFTALGNNTSSPGWICEMLTLADVDTQGELDALAFRWGFSNDADPDIGLQVIYAEVAVRESDAAGPVTYAMLRPAVVAP